MRPQYVQEHILVDECAREPHTGGHSHREADVPYPKNHRAQVKLKIVASARRLFNRHGFDNVSLDEIMLGAGLTRGGFYSYFQSKSELYAEVLGCFFTDPERKNCWEGIDVDLASRNAGPQVVQAYLSQQHFEDIENSCPMVELPGDVTRADASAKKAFETVFTAMVGVLERSVAGHGRRRRAKAEAIAALCVGGMVVARALATRAVADQLRDGCRSVALELGGWRSRRAPGRTLKVRHAAIRPADGGKVRSIPFE
jgi:TetR/AcrR family transcriptional repressor of nem operon